MWAEAFEVKYKGKDKNFGRAEFNEILSHCIAVDDAPCTEFGPGPIEAYPEAKVTPPTKRKQRI
jgi:hypothetical protein